MTAREEARALLAKVGEAAKAFVRLGEEFDYDPSVIHEAVDALEATLTPYYEAISRLDAEERRHERAV